MNYMPRPDDQDAVLASIPPVVLPAFRESVDHGFFLHARSRSLDPVGFAEYSESTKANMLFDRIIRVAKDLFSIVDSPSIRLRRTRNKRSTEFLLDPVMAARIKRLKKGRATSANYPTPRQMAIRSLPVLPPGQMVIPFPLQPAEVEIDDENRLWLTVVFDLDEIEENVVKVSIGVETETRFLWLHPMSEPELDIVGSISAPLADRMQELRAERSA